MIDSPRRWTALIGAGVVALGGISCLDQPSAAPRTGRVALAVRAEVRGVTTLGATDPAIRIHVFYRTTGGAAVALPITPSSVVVAAGATTTQPLLVDIAPCLADPDRAPAGVSGCELVVSLVLVLPGDVVADSESSSSEAPVQPGTAADVPPITLVQPAAVQVLPADGVNLLLEAVTDTVTAVVTDDSGNVLPGHPVQWSIAAPAIASIVGLGPDSGIVTPLAVGASSIVASTGGISGSTPLLVFPIASIGLSTVAVTDTFSLSSGVNPPPIVITVTDSGTKPLTGLTLDTVVYSPVALNVFGGEAFWLTPSLADTLAPTTLTLQPIPTQAGGPIATGVYTATFHVISVIAVNSPRKIVHTMVVIP